MSTRRRFVIDTDCGLDDAQAILMALAFGVEVVGITTVTGNAEVNQVCKNVLKVLQLVDKLEIPVYRGAAASLLRDAPTYSDYHGEDGLGDVKDAEFDVPNIDLVKDEHAVNAMVRIINENPGEITLICLGPLTNLALALQLDPTFGYKIKECHVMGGNYEAKGNITVCGEFNFRADPEAAYIVLNQLGHEINLVCWEICLKHHLTWEYYDGLVNNGSKVANFTRTCEKNITNKIRHEYKSEKYLCADQFSMAVALDSSVALEFTKCYATVELNGTHTRGQLVVDDTGMLKKEPNVQIVKAIDMQKF